MVLAGVANATKTLKGVVTAGHGIASGDNPDSPYAGGSVALQMPIFKELGLDLSNCFCGTINLDISPNHYSLDAPDYSFKSVNWTDQIPPEDFCFVKCVVSAHDYQVNGWIYYPHPETKPIHFHPPNLMEILCPFIPGVCNGDEVTVQFDKKKIAIYKVM